MRYSVIIPAYNCEKTIVRTVNSVLKSSLNDYEIIIINDGSTDNTEDVCRNLSALHPEVHCFFKQNGGVSSARNLGISKSQGEYILFVDADDELISFDITKIHQAVKCKADMIMFGMTFSYYWNEKIVKEEIMKYPEDRFLTINELPEVFESLFQVNYLSAIWNKFIRRDILIQNDIFFDLRLTNYEDLEFTIRVLQKCNLIAVLSDVNYIYKNSYGKDRTIDRIAKIEDIMENTDIIATSFFSLDENLYTCFGKHIEGIYSIVLRIYKEVFWFKLYSMKYGDISSNCNNFLADQYVKICLNNCPDAYEEILVKHIKNQEIFKIYLSRRYRCFRHEVANRVKLIIYLLNARSIK